MSWKKLEKIEDIERERLEEIKRINETYKKKKDKLRSICPELEDFLFDIITDSKLTTNGMRYAKRKAIFLHHLNKYFNVSLKENINQQDNFEGGNEDNNSNLPLVNEQAQSGSADINLNEFKEILGEEK